MIKYGKAPYKVVVLHGGPGNPGGVTNLAEKLGEIFNVLEPWQSADSISGQLDELRSIIKLHCHENIILIGHSWGAWLAFLYASRYSKELKKLILIGAGAFENEYNLDLLAIRLKRLNKEKKTEVLALLELINQKSRIPDSCFKKFGQLMNQADTYSPLLLTEKPSLFQPEIFKKVWAEASELRASGKLINYAINISCPVVAIHGSYDPHPVKGVEAPLSKTIKNFKLYTLEKCGHKPWNEKYAYKYFYGILEKEMKNTDRNVHTNLK